MSDIRTGSLIRAARRHRGLRQIDVAAGVGMSQETISLVELGRFESLGVRTLRKVAAAVGVELPFAPRYRGAEGDRLLDARHAHFVAAIVDLLRGLAWEVCIEYAFSHYGERGSVDVLAWHPRAKVLLVLEVKTELVDIQQTLRALSIKERVVPPLVSREKDWRTRDVGVVLVLPDERGRRDSVTRHAPIFDASLPARTVEVKRWLARPAGPLHGILFLSVTNRDGGKQGPDGRKRIRRQESDHEPPNTRSNDRSRPNESGHDRGQLGPPPA